MLTEIKKTYFQLQFEKNILFRNKEAELTWVNGRYTNLVTQAMWVGYEMAILSMRNNSKGKYVIARVEDNRPLFSQKPHVHTRFNKAKQEIDRLAETNPDTVFMMYQSILSRRAHIQNLPTFEIQHKNDVNNNDIENLEILLNTNS